MISQYYRWIFEKRKDESVLSLREWIIQESIAAETSQGFYRSNDKRPKSKSNGRTFFNRDGDSKCHLCHSQHSIWQCSQFKKMNIAERWNYAKVSGLCYRCLGYGHLGSNCTWSRHCCINGCEKTHNRLLHGEINNGSKE